MRLKALISSLCLLGFVTVPAFAATQSGGNQTKIDQISSETQALQKELAELRHEVSVLKQEQKKQSPQHYHQVKARHPLTGQPTVVVTSTTYPRNNEAKTASRAGTPNSTPIVSENAPMGAGRSQTDRLIQSYLQNLPLDWDNPGQSFVSIGPYINTTIQFSGGQLIVNDPKINTDVALLKLRKAAFEGMAAKGIHTGEDTHHSHLILSGILEGEAQYIRYGQQGGNSGAGNNGSSSNINLSSAEIDAFLLSPSPWVSGFFSFSYDSGTEPTETNSRVLNSNVLLNNAFIMLGDFLRAPYYGTLGQYYVPFGTYSSVMVTSPVTKTLGRTKARALLAGYQGQSENSFYTAVYAFKGDSHSSATSRINNGGINLGYHFNHLKPDVNGDIGVGYLANIADSVGMQDTGNRPMFNGFAGPSPYGNEKIVHRVPALDLRAIVTISSKVNLIGEYVGVTTSFNPNDLSFNGRGAKPWAVNTEAAYTFEAFTKPSSVGIGYGQASQALAIGLPERRMSAVFNTSIWHNTVQSLEVRHDINYASSTTATGSTVSPAAQGLGTSDDVVTLQFDLFF